MSLSRGFRGVEIRSIVSRWGTSYSSHDHYEIARYAVDADGVYLWTGGDNADAVALDPANGSERWRTPFTGRLGGTAATRDAVVHAMTSKLRLLSKEDGSELRMTRFDDSSLGATGTHRIAAAGGRLYVLMGVYGGAFRVYGSG